MSDSGSLSHALSQALSTMSLYGDDHPATARGIDAALERLQELQEPDPKLQFTFLSGEVLFGSESVHELEGWEWSSRLMKAGIERIEFLSPVELGTLRTVPVPPGRAPWHPPGLECRSMADGRIVNPLRPGDAGSRPVLRLEPAMPVATLSYTLREERETMDWVHQEIQNGAKIPMVEADAVVRSLSIAMHAEQAMVLPLLQLKEFDQYTTTHSMNVSVLAMALGEYLELGGATVRALGVAGLLHDLGKTCIPREILVKPGKLTEPERLVVRDHPMVGARMLLASPEPMELAAVVAYEHHVMLDGGGYPTLHDARGAQYASMSGPRLRRLRCATDQPPLPRGLGIRARSGIHPRAARESSSIRRLLKAFIAMMRTWDHRIAKVPA